MRYSFVISLILHGLLLGALFVDWHSASRVHLPEKVYSIKVIGSLRVRTARGAPARQEGVKVTAPKEAPKKKVARDKGPKVAVPKKQAKNQKSKAKSEAEAAAAEQARGETSGAGMGDGTGMVVDAAQFPFGYFLSAIERKVSDNWYSAVAQSGTGLTCVVYFRLMRDGSVQDVQVEKGSGNDYFDRSAIRAVKGASPFPPLPRGFQDDFLGIHFTFAQKE